MSSDALKSVPFPLPSLDRPFGAHLWPIFSRAFSAIKGYPPQDFRFQAGETPLSTLKVTAAMLVTYYVAVLGGRELMRSRPAFQLNGLFMIHNLYLTIISGSLLALFVEQLAPTVWRKGVFFAICDHQGGWTNELVILYYVCEAVASIGTGEANWRVAQLPDQIRRAHRHRLPRPEEETTQYASPHPILQALTNTPPLQPSCTPTTTAPPPSSATPSSPG